MREIELFRFQKKIRLFYSTTQMLRKLEIIHRQTTFMVIEQLVIENKNGACNRSALFKAPFLFSMSIMFYLSCAPFKHIRWRLYIDSWALAHLLSVISYMTLNRMEKRNSNGFSRHFSFIINILSLEPDLNVI